MDLGEGLATGKGEEKKEKRRHELFRAELKALLEAPEWFETMQTVSCDGTKQFMMRSSSVGTDRQLMESSAAQRK
jgi:hypothetical protein